MINDNEVMQTIYYEAMMMGQDPRSTLDYYQNNNLLPAIKMTMIEDRVLHYLLDKKFESSKKPKQEKDSKPKITKEEGVNE